MRAVTALLVGLAVSSPAAAIGPFAASEALQRNQGWVSERTPPSECERAYRSFLERNRVSPSRRRAHLETCLERVRQTTRTHDDPERRLARVPAEP
jgi:hypothetical protein